MKTQADKKSVKDIQELKQRFTKISIGLFAILTLSIILLASAYTYILQKSYTDIALESQFYYIFVFYKILHKTCKFSGQKREPMRENFKILSMICDSLTSPSTINTL